MAGECICRTPLPAIPLTIIPLTQFGGFLCELCVLLRLIGPMIGGLLARSPPLRQNVVDDFAMHIGQAPIGAAVAESQFLMIDPQQVQHRRV